MTNEITMKAPQKLKVLLAVAIVTAVASVSAQNKGSSSSDPEEAKSLPLALTWAQPGAELGSEAAFKVYYAPIGDTVPRIWTLVTNVSGALDQVQLDGPLGGGLFAVTTSNYWGELRPETRTVFPSSVPITINWGYEADTDPDLRFKIYHSQTAGLPNSQWQVLTNVAGAVRSVTFRLPPGFHQFALTASNALGESDFSEPMSTPPLPVNPALIRLWPHSGKVTTPPQVDPQ